MTVSMPLIQVIVGTSRPGRFSERPAAWLIDRLAARSDLIAELVDLRDYPMPFYDQMQAPARGHREYPPEVAAWAQKVETADGYIMITGEYNHGYPASLKNALDHVFPEFNRKPVAFVGYGGVGGAGAIEQLRQVALELEMAPIRYAIHILPEAMIAARQGERFDPEQLAGLDGRLQTLLDDLAWWAWALAQARARTEPNPA